MLHANTASHKLLSSSIQQMKNTRKDDKSPMQSPTKVSKKMQAMWISWIPPVARHLLTTNPSKQSIPPEEGKHLFKWSPSSDLGKNLPADCKFSHWFNTACVSPRPQGACMTVRPLGTWTLSSPRVQFLMLYRKLIDPNSRSQIT